MARYLSAGIGRYFKQQYKKRQTRKNRKKTQYQENFRKGFVHKDNQPKQSSIDKNVLPTHGSKRRLFKVRKKKSYDRNVSREMGSRYLQEEY